MTTAAATTLATTSPAAPAAAASTRKDQNLSPAPTASKRPDPAPTLTAAEIAARKKALDAALDQIDKQFGKGTIMRLGQVDKVDVGAIPTGTPATSPAAAPAAVPAPVASQPAGTIPKQ